MTENDGGCVETVVCGTEITPADTTVEPPASATPITEVNVTDPGYNSIKYGDGRVYTTEEKRELVKNHPHVLNPVIGPNLASKPTEAALVNGIMMRDRIRESTIANNPGAMYFDHGLEGRVALEEEPLPHGWVEGVLRDLSEIQSPEWDVFKAITRVELPRKVSQSAQFCIYWNGYVEGITRLDPPGYTWTDDRLPGSKTGTYRPMAPLGLDDLAGQEFHFPTEELRLHWTRLLVGGTGLQELYASAKNLKFSHPELTSLANRLMDTIEVVGGDIVRQATGDSEKAWSSQNWPKQVLDFPADWRAHYVNADIAMSYYLTQVFKAVTRRS